MERENLWLEEMAKGSVIDMGGVPRLKGLPEIVFAIF
jgi:hypothetical protein